jgi:adenylate kinase
MLMRIAIIKLLDAIEDEVLQGGYLIDWHACDLFPKSWIDLVVVLRCPSTAVHYDRLASRYASPWEWYKL